ncbi:nitroreductase/quinone reductase family protein [Nonomuraea sp. NPDC050663]|uniref:nitroreductase/quinone reductase family protein n=1 Tax=Nonomuraea sp. NPDC050663 TaxID=3364370 RepID=UPI0037B1877D
MDFAQADALNQAIRLLSLRHRARAAALLTPLGLHTGQEALLLELARTGPMIQAQLSEALGCEPPSVTLMTRKLEASGHIRRVPTPADKRATVVELTESGRALTEQIKDLWMALAEETVTGLPPETVSALPELINTLTANVDSRRPRAAQNRSHLSPGPTSPASKADQAHPLSGTYEPSASAWVREHVEQIMRTGTTDGVTIKGLPTVLVTYRGAMSGKIRKTPLMRVEHEGHYAAVASQGGAPKNPQWYFSLLAEPLVEVQDGTASGVYRAREVFGEEKALWWRHAVDAYPDYADYQLRTERRIPVFVLEPADVEPAGGGSTDDGMAD